jgi:hypothetical protein
MMEVCPVCNGLTEVLSACPNCQAEMSDQGAVTDYLGPYAPYELVTAAGEQEHYCLHAVVCGNCGFRQTIAVPLLPSPM